MGGKERPHLPEVPGVHHCHDEDGPPKQKYQRGSRIPERLRRTAFSFFSVPPKLASRRALSRAMSASRPSFTSAVFSSTPASLAAFLKSSSSILRVVRICINMHDPCTLCKAE